MSLVTVFPLQFHNMKTFYLRQSTKKDTLKYSAIIHATDVAEPPQTPKDNFLFY